MASDGDKPLAQLNLSITASGVVSLGIVGCLGAGLWYIWHRRSVRKPLLKAGMDIPQDIDKYAEYVAPAYENAISREARLYHSGQAALFSNKIHDLTCTTDQKIESIETFRVSNIRDWLGDIKRYPNRFFRTRHGASGLDGYNVKVSHEQLVLVDLIRKPDKVTAMSFSRAGPRDYVVFHPSEVGAAILTCGGLCPGLNDVIYELVQMLHYNYGVDRIYGIKSGFRGFYDEQYQPFMDLNPNSTQNIHKIGGTILGSSRGGFDAEKIIQSCLKHKINQVYIIGGDGTHRAAAKLHDFAAANKLKMTVVGIPKTIDNDISMIDRSFGFNTAVEEAVKAIDSVRIEAECVPNGIGIVKLMGRSSGYIAAHATLADRNVDLCLIPEISFELDGPGGVYEHVENTMKSTGSCVIVVAEGAGESLIRGEQEFDESGNPRLKPIGQFLKSSITKYFEEKDVKVNIKYNDPSYMIRSVPANAADSIYCMILAQNAVHGAMAGYSGFTSAMVNNRTCMIPMQVVIESSPTNLNPKGRTWERVTRSTHQPF